MLAKLNANGRVANAAQLGLEQLPSRYKQLIGQHQLCRILQGHRDAQFGDAETKTLSTVDV